MARQASRLGRRTSWIIRITTLTHATHWHLRLLKWHLQWFVVKHIIKILQSIVGEHLHHVDFHFCSPQPNINQGCKTTDPCLLCLRPWLVFGWGLQKWKLTWSEFYLHMYTGFYCCWVCYLHCPHLCCMLCPFTFATIKLYNTVTEACVWTTFPASLYKAQWQTVKP